MFKTAQAVSKPEKVMSTRTFAKKSGRQHGNVLTMLRKLIEKGELDLQESYYTNGNGSRQYAEFKLTLGDFEKITHLLKEKEIKGVHKYFGVPAYTVEKVVTGFGDHTIMAEFGVAEVRPAPPVQLTLLATSVSPERDELTMSSLEIAELTGKRHGDVIRDIRVIFDAIRDDADLRHVQILEDSRGYTSEIRLTRDLTETLVTGYSIPLRLVVVRRLRELEAQVAQPPAFTLPDFTNPVVAARAWASEFEGRTLALEVVKARDEKIAEDAPKVEVYHQIADASGLIGFQKFCTHLNLNQKEIKHWMKDIGWLRADQYVVNPLPTAKAVANGYCKITGYTTEFGKFTQQIWFTGKAVTYVTEKAPSYVRKKVVGTRSKAA